MFLMSTEFNFANFGRVFSFLLVQSPRTITFESVLQKLLSQEMFRPICKNFE